MFYFLTGFCISLFLFEKNMILPAAIQAISSAMGAMALLIFGGELSEN